MSNKFYSFNDGTIANIATNMNLKKPTRESKIAADLLETRQENERLSKELEETRERIRRAGNVLRSASFITECGVAMDILQIE